MVVVPWIAASRQRRRMFAHELALISSASARRSFSGNQDPRAPTMIGKTRPNLLYFSFFSLADLCILFGSSKGTAMSMMRRPLPVSTLISGTRCGPGACLRMIGVEPLLEMASETTNNYFTIKCKLSKTKMYTYEFIGCVIKLLNFTLFYFFQLDI